MKKMILAVVISAFAGNVSADESVHYEENDHKYERIDTKMSWSDAKEYCEEKNGYLVTVTSSHENDFIFNELARGDSSTIWLGGTDESREDSWRWVTGEEWNYEKWASGQPNNKNEGQDYLSFNSNGSRKWDDAGLPNHNDRKKFICEYEDSDGCDATYRNGRLTIIIDICS